MSVNNLSKLDLEQASNDDSQQYPTNHDNTNNHEIECNSNFEIRSDLSSIGDLNNNDEDFKVSKFGSFSTLKNENL